MSESGGFDDVPETIRQAFAGHPYLSTPKVARALEIDGGTLRKHTAAGDITCHYKGLGIRRPRRVYTLADVAGFLRKMRSEQCASGNVQVQNANRDRRSIGATSSSTVVALTRARTAPIKRRPKPK